MSTKVWGTLPTAHQPISLSYVMSEELAHKLQDKPVHEDVDKDLLLALELSKVEAENGNTSHHTSISSTDEDYLVALQLQQEEQSASYRVARPTGMAKLSVVYGEVRDEISDDIIPRLSEDEDSEDEVDEQEGLLDSLLENIDFVTKHNPILSGIRNADTLERSPVPTGNLNTPISNPVFSGLHESVKHQQVNQNKARGNKIKHSTNENVLDTHTRELLLKMLNAGIISELNGVVSTGKEANVYHAIGGEKLPDLLGKELAIKIYKTTLNEFRNRSEYLQHPIGNTRKLVKLWAEKEFQNLRRLKAKGLPVPDAVLQRENILLMTFIGKEGVPAPCFKDAVLSTKSLSSTYVKIVNIMRDMYQRCKLVHADLSEYNILYHAKQATVIDVSQSVEVSHGKATEFLRRDVANITNFFNKRGLDNIMTPIELFTFTTASELEPNSVFYKFLISKETETQSSEEPAVDTQ